MPHPAAATMTATASASAARSFASAIWAAITGPFGTAVVGGIVGAATTAIATALAKRRQRTGIARQIYLLASQSLVLMDGFGDDPDLWQHIDVSRWEDVRSDASRLLAPGLFVDVDEWTALVRVLQVMAGRLQQGKHVSWDEFRAHRNVCMGETRKLLGSLEGRYPRAVAAHVPLHQSWEASLGEGDTRDDR